MASITGCCPVCTEGFNAEARRPHCIPCGHVFCFDCLTRTCGTTLGSCPYCRTAFRTDEIRWLFLNYEYDNLKNIPRYASSTSMDSRTVLTALDWLHYAKEELEERVLELGNKATWSQEVSELQNEIHAWIDAYQALEAPHSTMQDSRPLELAAASLTFASRHNGRLADTQADAEELRTQLKKLRRDFRRLRKTARSILEVNREAKIKVLERDIEIRALRDLNRLYRGTSRPEKAFRTKPESSSEPQRPARSEGKRMQDDIPVATAEYLQLRIGTKKEKVPGDTDTNRSGLPVKKTVTWFRSSLRRSSATCG